MYSRVAHIKKPFCKKLRHSISEKTVDKTIGYCCKTIGEIHKSLQKTQGFCVADFPTLSDERRSRWKIFLLFIWIKESCVRKFEGLARSKLLGISQTEKAVSCMRDYCRPISIRTFSSPTKRTKMAARTKTTTNLECNSSRPTFGTRIKHKNISVNFLLKIMLLSPQTIQSNFGTKTTFRTTFDTIIVNRPLESAFFKQIASKSKFDISRL